LDKEIIMGNLDLDLTNVDMPNSIKDGDYTVVCDEAELKDTKSGTGKYVKCRFTVEDSGLKLFHMFNVRNSNPKAEQIGQAQLKQFATFGGHATPNNISETLELCGLRCSAHIKNKMDEYSGSMKPVITSFKKLPTF
jgi:hypothetical protein